MEGRRFYFKCKFLIYVDQKFLRKWHKSAKENGTELHKKRYSKVAVNHIKKQYFCSSERYKKVAKKR